MTTRRAFLALGLVGLLAACSPAGPTPGAATSPVQLTQAAIVSAINDVRARNGRPPLRYNAQLAAAARTQANLMASKDALSHTIGGALRTRVAAAGYEQAVGENLAAGQPTLEAAIAGWLASPGHRSTLLSDKFVEFGLAVARSGGHYGTYWAFIAGGPFANWYEPVY